MKLSSYYVYLCACTEWPLVLFSLSIRLSPQISCQLVLGSVFSCAFCLHKFKYNFTIASNMMKLSVKEGHVESKLYWNFHSSFVFSYLYFVYVFSYSGIQEFFSPATVILPSFIFHNFINESEH